MLNTRRAFFAALLAIAAAFTFLHAPIAHAQNVSLCFRNNNTGNRPCAVATPQSVIATPEQMYFVIPTSTTQQLLISDAGYVGSFTVTASTPGIVSWTNPSGASSYMTITPIAVGTTTLTITDGNGTSDTTSIGVTTSAPARPSASPSSLTFATSSSPAQTITMTQANFTGTYSVSGQAGIVTTVVSGTGSGSTIAVTPAAVGSTTLVINDGTGQTTSVPVTVQGVVTYSMPATASDQLAGSIQINTNWCNHSGSGNPGYNTLYNDTTNGPALRSIDTGATPSADFNGYWWPAYGVWGVPFRGHEQGRRHRLVLRQRRGEPRRTDDEPLRRASRDVHRPHEPLHDR